MKHWVETVESAVESDGQPREIPINWHLQMISSGKQTWKWPLIVDLPIKHDDFL